MNAQLKIVGQNPELLGLESVLVGSLPATLMTEDAPDHYTVEAVFTRKTDRDEVAAIQGSATRAHLAANGYPTEPNVDHDALLKRGRAAQKLAAAAQAAQPTTNGRGAGN